MPGVPKHIKQARLARNPHYGKRWCDRPGFVGESKNAKVPTPYRLCNTYGWISVKEEVYCWRLAYHGLYRRACREAYGREYRRDGKRRPTDKHLLRIQELKEMDARGEISLSSGPWEYYGMEREFPETRTNPVGYDDI